MSSLNNFGSEWITTFWLLFHSMFLFIDLFKFELKKLNYITEWIENFGSNTRRLFMLSECTILYMNMFYIDVLDEYVFTILYTTTITGLSAVLVHTFSEDLINYKLHIIYSNLTILFGWITTLYLVITFDELSIFTSGIYILLQGTGFISLYCAYFYRKSPKILVPFFEHCMFLSTLLVSIDYIYIKNTMEDTEKWRLLPYFIGTFFFVYFLASTEIRVDPEYNLQNNLLYEDSNIFVNTIGKLFHKKKKTMYIEMNENETIENNISNQNTIECRTIDITKEINIENNIGKSVDEYTKIQIIYYIFLDVISIIFNISEVPEYIVLYEFFDDNTHNQQKNVFRSNNIYQHNLSNIICRKKKLRGVGHRYITIYEP